MHHEIKIDEPFYHAVAEGRKTFEIRYNDRGYNAGDTVELYVYQNALLRIYAKIGYVTSYQQRDNFVVFSLLNVKVRKP